MHIYIQHMQCIYYTHTYTHICNVYPSGLSDKDTQATRENAQHKDIIQLLGMLAQCVDLGFDS